MVPADSRKISRVPRYSGAASSIYTDFGYGPFTLCGSTFQYFLLSVSIKFVGGPTTPVNALRHCRFGLLCVRSPLLAQSLLFSFPPAIEMFQFTGFAPRSAWCCNRLQRVAPFGNPRVYGYLPLTVAYRSLSRPSSPPRAQASFMCPSLLSFFFRLNLTFYLVCRFAEHFLRPRSIARSSPSDCCPVTLLRFTRLFQLHTIPLTRSRMCFHHVNVLFFVL